MTTTNRTTCAAAALALAVAALSLGSAKPAAAQTACAQWDLSGGWTAIQGSYRVHVRLEQQGTRVRGWAVYSKAVQLFDFRPKHAPGSGSARGTVRGNALEIQTSWGGVYVGTIDATGRIDGVTYDRRDSTSSAKWFSDRRMNCLVESGNPMPRPVPPPRLPPAADPIVDQGSSTLPPSRGAASSSVFRNGSVATSGAASVYCKPGFVWRAARSSDLVCVEPSSRERVAHENATAGERVVPGGGAYGPNTCRSGYVWREAFAGDSVCVTPSVRDLVREENRVAATRAQ